MCVFIKGFSIPETCEYCPCNNDGVGCGATGYIFSYADLYVKRMDDCPLKEIDIIYCKDCKHFVREDREEYTPYEFYNTYFDAFCDKHFDTEQGEFINVKFDDFCSFAERKEQDG